MIAIPGSRESKILGSLALFGGAVLFLIGAFQSGQIHETNVESTTDLSTVSPTTTAASGSGIEVDPELVRAAMRGMVPVSPLQDPSPPSGPRLAAKALYVDGINGLDSNPGTVDAPFRRPIDALSVVEPGTTVYLRAGVYEDTTHGSNVLRRSGTPDAWITIQPFPGEHVEIIAGGEWGNGFEFKGSSYAKISGFAFTGRPDSIHGSGVFGKDGSHDVIVSGNIISGFGGAGVSFVRSSRITVEANEVRNNAARSFYQGSGISLFEAEGPLRQTGGFTNVIKGNHVVGNYNGVISREGRLTDGNCIIIDYFNETNYQGSTLVENNVCLENGGRGVHVFYSSNVTARNNTLVSNNWSPDLYGGRAEMVAARGSNIRFYNNLVLNDDGIASFIRSSADDAIFINNIVASGPPDGPGNGLMPTGSATLVNPADDAPLDQFRPPVGSALAGIGRTDLQPPVDALGDVRPRRGTVGALEPPGSGSPGG